MEPQGDTLYLSAPDGIRTWVERRYARCSAKRWRRSARPDRVGFAAEARGGAEPRAAASSSLNPNYTFDRFVIGEGNRVAHAAALAVAEAPSEAYNPLFLHGPRAWARPTCSSRSPTTCGPTPPDSASATPPPRLHQRVRRGPARERAEAFKSRYRDLDVLLVDDVQFLEGKQHTEEEFFHTFNALYEGGSQLVLSADRLPSELSTLESRLRDRFEWGLTIPVEPPDLATRLTVLRRLAARPARDADGEALSELAGASTPTYAGSTAA